RPRRSTKSVLGHELEAIRAAIAKIERRLRRLHFGGAVVEDFLELDLKLLDVRVHVQSVLATPGNHQPEKKAAQSSAGKHCGAGEIEDRAESRRAVAKL